MRTVRSSLNLKRGFQPNTTVRTAGPTTMARDFCGRTRREFLWQTGGGFGAAALAGMLGTDGFFANTARAASTPSPVEVAKRAAAKTRRRA